MKISLQEPLFTKYLYISSDNIVHVLMPVVVSRTNIELGTACKSVYPLQEFFGKGGNSHQKATIKNELLAYKEALKMDISLLEVDAPLTQQKQERLTQIRAYLKVVTQLKNHPELDCLNQQTPSYPRPLEELMQTRATSNLYSIVLRPTVENKYLRSEAGNPIFSVAHKSVARSIEHAVSPLQQALIQAYSPLIYEARNLKLQVIQQVLTHLDSLQVPCNFEQVRQILQQTIEALLNVSVDLTKNKQGEPINQKDIDAFMGLNPQTTEATKYIEALLECCASDLFDTVMESPFNTLTQAESWSIATQFLLGITNVYCVAQRKISLDTNFGCILDSMPALSNSLAQTLAQAQQSDCHIEEACLSWMNEHSATLKFTAFTREDIKAIKKVFATSYSEIKDSPYFDEFFLLATQKKGDFVFHQEAICTSFAKFVCSPLFNLTQELTKPLERACTQSSSLSTEIPLKNALIQGEIEINTATLGNTALQALYNRIHSYTDPNLKAQLLAQLKQERPDFKPQIKNAKQFLQHIAYGEQNEAETLLQKNPQSVQELLRTHNIPFTDYSDRTFTCTAYEYAYWAKDAHMLRMLEKYILQDEETRQFIVKRISHAPSSWFSKFFVPCTPVPCTPKGLHYTTKGSAGETIDHWETHFNLAPLKQALKTFLKTSAERSLHECDSDWEALERNWEALDNNSKQIGLLQRKVPAHIAQEYNHPDRSFSDVSEDRNLLDTSTPANLKRQQVRFFDCKLQAYYYWFPSCDTYSAFVHSSAVVRGGHSKQIFGVERWRLVGWLPALSISMEYDLLALEAIDKVRTKDLKQSLDILNQPLIVQASPSPSISMTARN